MRTLMAHLDRLLIVAGAALLTVGVGVEFGVGWSLIIVGPLVTAGGVLSS